MSTFDPPSYPGDQPDPAPEGPSYPSYPTDGSSGNQLEEPYSATAAIGWGWRKFTENVGPILLAIVAFVAFFFVIGLVTALIMGPEAFEEAAAAESLSTASIVLNLLFSLLGLYLSAAFYRASLDVADGQRFNVFSALGRVNILSLVAMTVILYVLVIVGFLLLILPGIAVIFFSYFATYAVVDGLGPIAALKRSFTIVGKNFGSSLLLLVLSILVIFAGVLALVIGLLVAYPVVGLAAAYTYRRFNGQPVAP